jgi:chromate reductase, NAD(P)H dehydrogenase (quinone)
MTPKILALSGSSRRESLNSRLLDIAIAGAKARGAEVTLVSLADFELPVYEGDWEAEHGLPEAARTLQTLVSENHGLLIATPEHNGGYTTLLKNSIDWISRPDDYQLSRRPVFPGKVSAMISASPHPTGGLRSQLALEMVLHRLGVLVVPTQFYLGCAHKAFDPDGELTSAATDALARHVGSILVDVACRLVVDRAASLDWGGSIDVHTCPNNDHEPRTPSKETAGLR